MLATIHLAERDEVDFLVLGPVGDLGRFVKLQLGDIDVYIAGYGNECAERLRALAAAAIEAADELSALTQPASTEGAA